MNYTKKRGDPCLLPVPHSEASRIAHLSWTSNAKPTPMSLYNYPYTPNIKLFIIRI